MIVFIFYLTGNPPNPFPWKTTTYIGYRYPGDVWDQGISSYDIDIVFLKYSGPCKLKVNSWRPSDAYMRQ